MRWQFCPRSKLAELPNSASQAYLHICSYGSTFAYQSRLHDCAALNNHVFVQHNTPALATFKLRNSNGSLLVYDASFTYDNWAMERRDSSVWMNDCAGGDCDGVVTGQHGVIGNDG